VDTSKWTVNYDTYIAPNNELECYKRENVGLRSGSLVITARQEPTPCGTAGFQNYSSGMLRTAGKFSTAYGRFEMRAKFPKGKGMWPAFWTTSENYPYGGNGRSGELDIVEVIGSRPDYVVGTAHWAYNGCGWGCSRYGYEYKMPVGDTADGFHTYALEWEPGRLAWYMDGVKYYEIGDNGTYKWGSLATQLSKTTDYSTNPLAAYPAPFDGTNPQKLILNLAVGGNWPGSPDASTTFPAEMLVDYVRVFKR
jgi:beta-glucanase (GH16 family)